MQGGLALLKITDLAVSYGSFRAVKRVSLRVPAGAFVALIGSNGAGKTTTARCVSGLIKPVAGRVEFDGREITGEQSHVICGMGLVQVPEGRKLFPHMTVQDNLRLGAFLPRCASREEANRQKVYELFPRLLQRRNQLAGTLSGGEQQMLAFGRALMAEPRLLVLDEPTLGLSPKLAAEVLAVARDLNERGITMLVVCQEVLQVLRLAHHAYVMENGETVMDGPARGISEDPEVRRVYLGL